MNNKSISELANRYVEKQAAILAGSLMFCVKEWFGDLVDAVKDSLEHYELKSGFRSQWGSDVDVSVRWDRPSQEAINFKLHFDEYEAKFILEVGTKKHVYHFHEFCRNNIKTWSKIIAYDIKQGSE